MGLSIAGDLLTFLRRVKNASGQVALFVVLTFQVLFVLFAMAVNVSLVVHDKINLQNSVDLAAYYAAAKQAEYLNSMAHQNYQIRQSYKLYAWRTRVLGTMSLTGRGNAAERHPTLLSGSRLTETEYFGGGLNLNNGPRVCIISRPIWIDTPASNQENLCQERNIQIPSLPRVRTIASFVGINAVIESITNQNIASFTEICKGRGAWNWWFTNGVKTAYRQDQANRKQIILAMANSLARSNSDFTDIDGQSVFAGVVNTVNKNLTYTNFGNGGAQIQMFNSMGGVAAESWMKETFINTFSYYNDFISSSDDCDAVTRTEDKDPEQTGDYNRIMNQLGGNDLRTWAINTEPPDSHMRLGLGFEKNPWYMAYVGVKASTQTRSIFHPIGGPVTITAQAYAKPFGGRMGPWYMDSWPRGAPESTGIRVDPLAPPRTQQNGLLDSPDDPTRIPNYSRFPGDRFGLASVLAQGSLGNIQTVLQASVNYYTSIFGTMTQSTPNDPLAWNNQANQPVTIRNYEIAAIAPDLFDISYYTVEPNYWANYGNRVEANRDRLGIPSNVPVRPDLGYRNGIQNLAGYNIQNQIRVARDNDIYVDRAFFYTRQREHLLTGWIGSRARTNFYPDAETLRNEELFANCQRPDGSEESNNSTPTNPGSCIWGGRTGYSVKLISRDYLLNDSISLGGNQGSILNPPPAEFLE